LSGYQYMAARAVAGLFKYNGFVSVQHYFSAKDRL
jgi:hypothetical protein